MFGSISALTRHSISHKPKQTARKSSGGGRRECVLDPAKVLANRKALIARLIAERETTENKLAGKGELRGSLSIIFYLSSLLLK